MKIDIAPVKQWFDGFVSLGLSAEKLLSILEIEETTLTETDARIPAKHHIRMLEFGATQVESPGIILQMGSQTKPENMGIVGALMMNAPTLLAAGHQIVRYAQLLSESIQWQIVETPLQYEIHYRQLDAEHQSLAGTEASLSATIGMLRFLSSKPINALTVSINFPDPGYADVYESIFGVAPTFNSPDSVIAISKPDGLCAIPHQQSYVVELLKQHADSLLEKVIDSNDHANSMSTQVKQLIATHLSQGIVDIDWVSSQLAVSRWTLNRRLKSEGTTFNTLLRDMRAGLTKNYLAQQNLSVTDIAFLLGYSETSAFQRACKNWFECSPKTLRQQLMQ